MEGYWANVQVIGGVAVCKEGLGLGQTKSNPAGSVTVCIYVWECMSGRGVVVVSLARGLRSQCSSPTQAIFFHLIFHLPPTTPTSPPSCDWVPGICWGANSRPFLMKQQWSRWDFGCPHHLL